MSDIRIRLSAVSSAATPDQRELLFFAGRYLNDAAAANKAGRPFAAQRFADAADACGRAVEHLKRVSSDGPRPPRKADPKDRLRQVYFRLRLCNYFLEQIPAPAPKRILDLAREYYEQAIQSGEIGKEQSAGELTLAADDLTHALESLAQAYLPDSPR